MIGFIMNKEVFLSTFGIFISIILYPIPIEAQTPYGSCSETAQYYQEQYERDGQVKDMVCMQKALEREMTNGPNYSCGESAQYYQTAYEKYGRVSDLVCMQEALEREMQ